MDRTRRRCGLLASLALAAAVLDGAAVPAAAAAPNGPAWALTAATIPASPIALPTTSGATPYVDGTSIAWLAENPGPLTEGPGPANTLGGSIVAMAGGAPGLVGIGSDRTSGPEPQAASWISRDGGAAWEKHVVAEAGASFSGLAARGGVFVTSSARGVFFSRDGASWARAEAGPPGPVSLINALDGFVATTSTSTGRLTRLWRSADASRWTAIAVPASLRSLCGTSLAASGSRILALGFTCASPYRARILVSTNGRTWSWAAVPAAVRGASLSYAGGRFLLIGTYTAGTRRGTAVWSSVTGTAWRRTSFVPFASPYVGETLQNIVRFGPGYITAGWLYDATADDCWAVAWSSPDLVHWKRALLPNAPYSGTCAEPTRVAPSRSYVMLTGFAWDIGGSGPIAWVGRLVP